MDTILVYQDSVESTAFDFANVVRTIKGFDMDPLSIVPAVFDKNGSKTTVDVDEYLDYAFGDCHASSCLCGYLTSEASILSFVNAYVKYGSRSPIVARPTLIDGNGNIMVEESVYYAVCDYILPRAALLIINHFEAELLSEMECKEMRHFHLASKKIGNEFGCAVWILASEANGMNNIVYDGVHIRCFANPEKPFNSNYSLKTTVACQLVWGKPVVNAIKDTVVFLSEVKDPEVEGFAEAEASAEVESAPVVSEPVNEATVEAQAFVDSPVVSAPSSVPEIDFPNSHIEEAASVVAEVETAAKVESEVMVEAEPETVAVAEVAAEPEVEMVAEVETVAESESPAESTATLVAEAEKIEAPVVAEPKVEAPVVRRPYKFEVPARFAAATSMATSTVASKASSVDMSASKASAVDMSASKIEEQIVDEPESETETAVSEAPVKPSSYFSNGMSRTAIPSANILKDRLNTTSATSTSSLISPAKSLRDIARSIGNTPADSAKDAPSPAVTSSLAKETANQRTLSELASLRERMDRLKSASEPKPARIDDITALGN